MPPRTTKIAPPKFQGLALAMEIGMLAYLSFELSRVYRGTHPTLSRKLAEAGVWPPPRLPTVRESGNRQGGGQEKEEDVRWMNINGVPMPASFDALTGFWRR